jgi:hypothetical protein
MRRSRKPLCVLTAYREFESLPLRCRAKNPHICRRFVLMANLIFGLRSAAPGSSRRLPRATGYPISTPRRGPYRLSGVPVYGRLRVRGACELMVLTTPSRRRVPVPRLGCEISSRSEAKTAQRGARLQARRRSDGSVEALKGYLPSRHLTTGSVRLSTADRQCAPRSP